MHIPLFKCCISSCKIAQFQYLFSQCIKRIWKIHIVIIYSFLKLSFLIWIYFCGNCSFCVLKIISTNILSKFSAFFGNYNKSFFFFSDEFNTRILNPDLTKEELEALHLQAQQMYNTYFASHALDRINFDDDIVQEIKNS